MREMMRDIEQIRRAHNSARPKASNPAWVNTHRDCGVLLAEIERLSAELEAMKKDRDHYWDAAEKQFAALKRTRTEVERLRWERDQYKENARRMSGLRDSENA